MSEQPSKPFWAQSFVTGAFQSESQTTKPYPLDHHHSPRLTANATCKILRNPSRLAVEGPGSHTEVKIVYTLGSVESFDGQGLAVG